MSSVNVKEWLDDNFENFETYLVEVKTPEGEKKEFLVAAEVPQQLGGAVHEFTRKGGEFVGYEEVDLNSVDIDATLKTLDSLIVSEHLFESQGKVDIPLILDLPDITATPVEKIEARFREYALEEGRKSMVEEYDSCDAPEELSAEIVAAAMEAREQAIKDVALYPAMTVENAVNAAMADFFSDMREKNGGFDVHSEAFHNHGLSDFADWADNVLSELGIETALDEVTRDAFTEGCMEKDTSSALDWIDQDVVVNFHPTVASDGYLDDGMITCDSVSGDAYNVVPDENFQAALTFFNISAQEYEDCLKTMSDGNFVLSRDNEEWAKIVKEHGSLDAWCPKADPKAGHLVSPDNLVELVENTNGYGVLCWGISVNLKDLTSVPPGEKVTLSGGQIGFHDYANGSGHMEGYAEGSKEVDLSTIHFTPDLLKRYGLDSVYGMTKSATDGELKWNKEDKARYLDRCLENYKKEWGIDEGSSPKVDVDAEGYTTMTNQGGYQRRLTEVVQSAQYLYGKAPDLAHLMNEKDRKDLGIANLSTGLSL